MLEFLNKISIELVKQTGCGEFSIKLPKQAWRILQSDLSVINQDCNSIEGSNEIKLPMAGGEVTVTGPFGELKGASLWVI